MPQEACLSLIWTPAAKRVGFVRYATTVHGLPMHAVAPIIVHWRQWCVNRERMTVGAAETRDLRIQVRMNAPASNGSLLKSIPGTTCVVLRRPMELYEVRDAFCVHKAIGIDAETLHHAEAPGDGTIGHYPSEHVRGLRNERHKVPERTVR